MTPSVENKWLFPLALFGHYRDCRKTWRALLDATWRADSWEAALSGERHGMTRQWPVSGSCSARWGRQSVSWRRSVGVEVVVPNQSFHLTRRLILGFSIQRLACRRAGDRKR